MIETGGVEVDANSLLWQNSKTLGWPVETLPDREPQLMLKAEHLALRRFLLPLLKFSVGSNSKESTCNAGDLDSIPGCGRPPREGNGNPLQYSCLENSMDRLQSMRLPRARHNWSTNTFTFLSNDHSRAHTPEPKGQEDQAVSVIGTKSRLTKDWSQVFLLETEDWLPKIPSLKGPYSQLLEYLYSQMGIGIPSPVLKQQSSSLHVHLQWAPYQTKNQGENTWCSPKRSNHSVPPKHQKMKVF